MNLKEQLEQLGNQIWNSSRTELYISMRFLDLALNSLDFRINLNTRTAGTDGISILYNPYFVIERYQADPTLVNRSYFHMVLHCIFRHMMQLEGKDAEHWNLACDIAAESIIDKMTERCIHLTVSDEREEIYEILQSDMKVLTAEGIYRFFQAKQISEKMFSEWAQIFREDDHSFWEYLRDNPIKQNGQNTSDHSNKEESENKNTEENKEQGNPNNSKQNSNQDGKKNNNDVDKQNKSPNNSAAQSLMTEEQRKELEDRWNDISERMETDLNTFGKQRGDLQADFKEILHMKNQKKVNYREFLQRFSVLREEMQMDLDSFDLSYYTYGMQLYGNVPLIEPYEFKEVRKIKEFIIAIDTSGSCKESLVKKFLNETYSILKDSENFFQKVNIHIIECDAEIQRDEEIHSLEELQKYQEEFLVQGFGGTDFTPVFEYISRLQGENKLKNLKGLLYFTDGDGKYPKKKPPYETVFVFFKQQFNEKKVPPWAMKLVIDEDYIEYL